MENIQLLNDIISVCHLLYAKGYVAATDGNVSVRLTNGNYLTTRSGINKGAVAQEDILEIGADGQIVRASTNIAGYKPSTEFGMHLFIYNSRPDVHAVVHAHPVYATGFAAARQPLVSCVFPEVIVGLGAIPLAEYATPSTIEVAQSLQPYVKHTDAILLANHGVVTYGKELLEAYYKMEKVEHAAHITFVARMVGGEKLLSEQDIEKLKAISVQSYGKDVTQKLACTTTEHSDETGDEDVRSTVKSMLRL